MRSQSNWITGRKSWRSMKTRVWSQDDFEAGERILNRGRPAVMVKVYPKTLRM